MYISLIHDTSVSVLPHSSKYADKLDLGSPVMCTCSKNASSMNLYKGKGKQNVWLFLWLM